MSGVARSNLRFVQSFARLVRWLVRRSPIIGRSALKCNARLCTLGQMLCGQQASERASSCHCVLQRPSFMAAPLQCQPEALRAPQPTAASTRRPSCPPIASWRLVGSLGQNSNWPEELGGGGNQLNWCKKLAGQTHKARKLQVACESAPREPAVLFGSFRFY